MEFGIQVELRVEYPDGSRNPTTYFHRIPAVDETGHLAGIVTFDDFVVLLGRELKHLSDVVETEIPPYEHT